MLNMQFGIMLQPPLELHAEWPESYVFEEILRITYLRTTQVKQ